MNTKEKSNNEQNKDSVEWDEKRMDIIGQNGNDALHYDEAHLSEELKERVASILNDYAEYVKNSK